MGIDVYAIGGDAGKDTVGKMKPELYFRDCYNSLSLANWLAHNVDAAARGTWGLAIFTEPLEPLNSPEWRRRLLQLARFWAESARLMRGHETLVGYMGDPPQRVSAEDTNDYIEQTEELLRFAAEVHRRGLKVVVWA